MLTLHGVLRLLQVWQGCVALAAKVVYNPLLALARISYLVSLASQPFMVTPLYFIIPLQPPRLEGCGRLT